MSKTLPYKCHVENCQFSNKITYAEPFQFKGHLREHDYIELQKTALKLNLISTPMERRSPNWLVGHIIEASIVKENIMEI